MIESKLVRTFGAFGNFLATPLDVGVTFGDLLATPVVLDG